MHCLVCSSQDITSFETLNDLKQHWYCNNCEVRFLDPTHYLSSDNEKERYEEHNNVIQDEGYRTFLSKVTNPLEKHLQKNDFGIDYGCGHGPALADILKKKGFKIDLYDPYFYPDKTVFKNKYEFITCTEAAEHFYNPLAEFNRMNEIKRPADPKPELPSVLGPAPTSFSMPSAADMQARLAVVDQTELMQHGALRIPAI